MAGLVGCSSSDEVLPTTSLTGSSAPQPVIPTTTVPTTAIGGHQPIVRPYIDPSVCGAGAAKETDFKDDTWYPFGLAREAPIPLQVIGELVDGVAHPFAVVLRLFHPDRDFTSGEIAVVNDAQVSIDVETNGNSQATWTLPDNSIAYVRARDLDKTALTALITRLTPREPTAAIPGFDYRSDSTDTDALRLLHEGTNTGLAGTITTFQCQTDAGQHIYRIQAIDGDPLVVYLGIIDAPRPYAVGTNGSGAITIYGTQDPAAPTLVQVAEADPAVWAALPVLS
jgi:hypothetical protein